MILRHDTNILLFKRNIPGKMGFGLFALPGGTVETDETVKQAACREAVEELGIRIALEDVSIVHMLRLREKYDAATNKANKILMLYVAEVKQWKGEPENLEPDKHSDLTWFDIHNLPDNLFSVNQCILNHVKNGVLYSEYGWEY